jgi:ribosomal protein S14
MRTDQQAKEQPQPAEQSNLRGSCDRCGAGQRLHPPTNLSRNVFDALRNRLRVLY